MLDESNIFALAGKVGELRGEMTGVNNKIDGIKNDLESYQKQTNGRFDLIDEKLDRIEGGVSAAAARKGVWRSIGAFGWSAISVTVLAFGEAISNNWGKVSHFFGF
jgi:hypothetical protein